MAERTLVPRAFIFPMPGTLNDETAATFQQIMAHAAKGKLRIDTERVPLADVENAWQRN